MHFLKSITLLCCIHTLLAIPILELHLDQIKETQPRLIDHFVQKQQENRIIHDIYEQEEEEDFTAPDFPEFQNADTNEFFENLPKHLIEEIEMNEPILEEEEGEEEDEDIKQIEMEDSNNHHHHAPIEPNIQWHRASSGRFYPETRLKLPQTSTTTTPPDNNDTLKFGLLLLASLFIYALLKYRNSSDSTSASRIELPAEIILSSKRYEFKSK